MNIATNKNSYLIFGIPVILLIIACLYMIFKDGLLHTFGSWELEEYSHSYLIPFVTGYLIWKRKELLVSIPNWKGSWLGVFIFLIACGLFLLGELASVYTLIEYAAIIALIAIVLSFTGWQRFKLIAIPLFILFFVVPLPSFLYNNLSAELQLISSKIGVYLIRLFGISVYLEGNIIDLGVYKLQVAEACNGLRYLFPLTTLSFICAYLFQQPLWKRVVVFFSAIPITIFMNSFRIAVIGVLVEHWGISMAEGFLHDFEGWVVFMLCFAVLILEMYILANFIFPSKTFSESFGLDHSPKGLTNVAAEGNILSYLSKPFILTLTLLVGMSVYSFTLPDREEVIPERTVFDSFPKSFQEWESKPRKMELVYINELSFDDYLLSDYIHQSHGLVNLYIAYYESQRKGEAAHSPRSCLPGGGWKIISSGIFQPLKQHDVGQDLKVNRILTQLGSQHMLVYYWFKQRNRNITNEFLVKWYLFWDALTRKRTDGALIRLTTVVPAGQDINKADERLIELLELSYPQFEQHIPD